MIRRLPICTLLPFTTLFLSAQVCVNSDQPANITWAGPGIVGNGNGSCVSVNAPGDHTVFAVASGGCTKTLLIPVVRATAPDLTAGDAPVLVFGITSAYLHAH